MMTTRTEQRKARRKATVLDLRKDPSPAAAKKLAKLLRPRNVGVLYTIKQLKADHRLAGGHYFDLDGTSAGPITHGHPYVGPGAVLFVERYRGGARVMSVDGAKVNPVSVTLTLHGAHQACRSILDKLPPPRSVRQRYSRPKPSA